MARMVPNTSLAEIPYDGEREVFAYLRDSPETKDWVVLHSLHIASHVNQVEGEADFVAVIPSEGVVVIEVKGHRTIRIHEGQWWFGSNPKGPSTSPIKQAADNRRSVQEFLEKKWLTLGGQVRKMPILSSLVCLPYVDVPNSIEWGPESVVNGSDFKKGSLAKRAIASIKTVTLQTGLEKNVLSPRDVELLVELLRFTKELLIDPHAEGILRKEKLLQATNEQLRVLDVIGQNRRIIVDGLAGTGKSILGMEMAIRMSRTGSGLLLTNGRLASIESKKALSQFGATNITTMSFVEFLHSRLPKSEKGQWPFILSDELILRALDAAIDGSPEPLFDWAVIDEAQDLPSADFLSCVDLVLNGGTRDGQWVLLGDFARQGIFSGKVSARDLLKALNTDASIASLTVNCRNARPVAEVLSVLLRGEPTFSAIRRTDDLGAPHLHYLDSPDHLVSAVTKVIDGYLSRGISCRDIAVLSLIPTSQSACDGLMAPSWKLSTTPTSNRDIQFASVWQFKGLEATHVILVDVAPESSWDANEFYVGVTRATADVHLFLLSTDRQSMIKRLAEKVDTNHE
jgi:hypothetical protein